MARDGEVPYIRKTSFTTAKLATIGLSGVRTKCPELLSPCLFCVPR